LLKEITIEDKPINEKMRLIDQPDEDDKSALYRMIDFMLPREARAESLRQRWNLTIFLLPIYSNFYSLKFIHWIIALWIITLIITNLFL
jgi:hypothetical protein